MSGLDKMISQIKEEADTTAAQILDEANAKATEIRKEADRVCKEVADRAETQKEAAREDILSRNRSAAQMQRRRSLLQTKQEVIDEIIDAAHASLLAEDTPVYFDNLVKILQKHVQPQNGEIRFNQKDLDRLPEDFPKIAADVAAGKGGTLRVSEKPCEIDGGFLLVYGDIEENCSFDTLFLAERENLQDKLHTFLFA